MIKTEKLGKDELEKIIASGNPNEIIQMCVSQKLSQDFIRKHKNKLNWTSLSTYQNMSEDFMWKLKEYIDFKPILEIKKLSFEFLIKVYLNFYDKKVFYDCLRRNKNIKDEIKKII